MKKLLSWGFVPLFALISLNLYAQEILSQSDTIEHLLIDEYFLSEITIQSKQKSSSTVTIVTDLDQKNQQGTAALLQGVPGLFADASTGEVFSRVFSRGVSLSAEDDIGWFYNSLQEDGMPITMVNYNQFSPDLFHRPDIGIRSIEVVKGGKSGILAANSPGTIVNFISQRPTTYYRSHDKLSTGFHQNGKGFIRIEGYSGGPIGASDWSFDMSYLYRYDQGNRNADYALNKGGQFKVGLYKKFENGLVSLNSKILGDRTNRYTGVAATNWDQPQAAFGMSFQNTTLLPPAIDGLIPDGRTSGSTSYEYNPANGIQSKEWSTVLSIDFNWGDWRLSNKSKLSLKRVDWQTAIGGQPLGLDNFISYFISGDVFPAGIVSFTPVGQNNGTVTVNNAGMLAAFQGQAPSFEYINGTLANDAIMGSGAWKKDDQINEIMNDLRITKYLGAGNSALTLGSFYARSNVDIFTNASFIYTTYEPEPQLLEVQLTDFDGNERALSDASGLSNYGGLLYEEGDIDVNTFSLYGQLNLDLTENWTTDLGLRYDRIAHQGLKYNNAPLDPEDFLGIDGDPSTAYDRSILGRNGSDAIDFNYDFMSYSLGTSYAITKDMNVYARYSITHKSPELNYYLNNFSNVPIDGPGEIQDITQLEIGLKKNTTKEVYGITAFYSNLSNVPYSNFEFDEQFNTVFYTPTQLNNSRTVGLELEYARRLNNQFSITVDATLQDAQLGDFNLYDAGGSVDPTDDAIISFSDNKVPHQADIMSNVAVQYEHQKVSSSLSWRYIGERFGNFENAFVLPSYNTFNLRLAYDISDQWYVSSTVSNLLNTAGLNNFFGPNEFGSSSDAASTAFINANPNASFVVFPISGRTVSFSVGYRFNK